MKRNQHPLLLAFFAYGIGVVTGLFVVLVAAWADMESTAYGFSRLADAGLRGLHCPILMTPGETGTISLDISNRTENQLSPSIRVQVSTSILPEEFIENIQLIPGESKRLTWAVDAENIDMGSFVFAKALLFSAYPLPSREATCGIFVIDLPGTGRMILPLLVALSLLGTGWGLRRIHKLRAANQWLMKHMGSLTFLAAMVVLGLGLSFIGGWLATLLVLIVAVLTIIILLGSRLASMNG